MCYILAKRFKQSGYIALKAISRILYLIYKWIDDNIQILAKTRPIAANKWYNFYPINLP